MIGSAAICDRGPGVTSTTRLGILLMIGGVVSLTVMDVFAKFALVIVSPVALVYIRAMGSTVVLGAATRCWTELVRLSPGVKALLACRAAAYLVAILGFFWALERIPIGEVVTLNAVAPVIMTALAWTILRESVSVGAVIAVILGGSGAIVVGGSAPHGLEPGHMAAFLGATAYAVAQILSKSLSTRVTPETMTFSGQLGAALALLPGLGLEPFAAVIDHPLLFAAVLATGLGGQLLIQWAIRRVSIGTLAPLEYLAVPLSFVLGALIWKEEPTIGAIAGGALIVVAGLIVWRDRSPRGIELGTS